MPRSAHDVIVHGAVGGLLAGAVVALWFFIADTLGGPGPFHTPTILAGAVLEREVAAPTFRLVATYTVLHFGVFLLFGLGTAWFLSVIDVSPGLLVGAVFGLGVLDGVHYGALLLTGSKVLTVLPVEHVLASNLLAGMTVMAYLHHALRATRPLGLGALRGHPALTAGIVTGLVGAAATALWFFVLDILFGRPFHTPAALGSALLLGGESPAAVGVSFGVVAAYSIVHLAAFSAAGTLFVWVAHRIERAPDLWLLVLMSFIVLEALFVGTVGLLSDWLVGAVGWWAVGVGNLIAVAAMGWWVWQRTPELRRRLLQEPVRTRV